MDILTVVGKLPPEMDGMFVRNGPNRSSRRSRITRVRGRRYVHGCESRMVGELSQPLHSDAGLEGRKCGGRALYGSFLDPHVARWCD